jgi:hypothetical protein
VVTLVKARTLNFLLFSLSNLKTHKKHTYTGFWELGGVNGCVQMVKGVVIYRGSRTEGATNSSKK